MRILITDSHKTNKIYIIFNYLKQFSDTVVLNFDESGIYIQGMDSSHICLFECKLTREWFDNYDYCTDKNGDVKEIGISTKILGKVISTFDEDQDMEIEVKPKSEYLLLNFINGRISCDKYFELPIIDIDIEKLIIPEQESDVDLTLSSKRMYDLVSQFQIFNDDLEMSFTDSDILMKASGMNGSMTVKMSLDDVTEYAIGEDFLLKQTFSLRYIHMMCIFNKLSNEIVMAFKKEHPMLLFYDLEYDSYLRFFMASKFDE
jgi:proliferating cell nuclear antigen PCNA